MQALIWLIAGFGLSAGVVHFVLQRAQHLRLIQAPNHRSSHEIPTPSGGGLGIVISATALGAALLLHPGMEDGMRLGLFLLTGTMLAAMGLIDDRAHLSARSRLSLQVLIVGATLLGIGAIPFVESGPVSGSLLILVLMLGGVWWINLFNFMDGTDGLAGSEALFILLGAALLIAWHHPGAMASPLWAFMLCAAGACLGFLAFNWPPARVFMGDVGSTWIAYCLFVVALMTMQYAWMTLAAWAILGAVFVSDATITLLTRLARRERWYEAHRSHAYQQLSRKNVQNRTQGHRKVVWLALAINIGWLLPLAGATLQHPRLSLICTVLAYLPIVIGVMKAKAGYPDPT